jgi:hypothetical protein
MRWSWAQLGHKPVGLLLDHPIGEKKDRLRAQQDVQQALETFDNDGE